MEIEDLLGLLGLNLPRVLGVNLVCEIVKTELEALDLWKQLRDYGWLIPLVAAAAFCWVSGEDGWASIPCGAMYGAAAIALHEVHSRF
jgi:hypothetical protein